MDTPNSTHKKPSNGSHADIGRDVDRLQDASEQSADKMKRQAGDMAEDLKSAASGLAEDARGSASRLASEVGDTLREAAEEQRDRGARSIEGVAGAVRNAADDLESEVPYVADYVRQAANGLNGFSQALRERSMGELVDSVSGFARQQPAAFFAGSVLLGFAASRFLKSSTPPPEPKRLPPAEPRSMQEASPRPQPRAGRGPKPNKPQTARGRQGGASPARRQTKGEKRT